MRSPLLRLAAGLLLLVACDKKKKYPTEFQTGFNTHVAPAAPMTVATTSRVHAPAPQRS